MTYRSTMVPSALHAARHQPHNNITNGLRIKILHRAELHYFFLSCLCSTLNIIHLWIQRKTLNLQKHDVNILSVDILVGAIKVRHEPVNYLTGLIAPPPASCAAIAWPSWGSQRFQRSHGRKVEIGRGV